MLRCIVLAGMSLGFKLLRIFIETLSIFRTILPLPNDILSIFINCNFQLIRYQQKNASSVAFFFGLQI